MLFFRVPYVFFLYFICLLTIVLFEIANKIQPQEFRMLVGRDGSDSPSWFWPSSLTSLPLLYVLFLQPIYLWELGYAAEAAVMGVVCLYVDLKCTVLI